MKNLINSIRLYRAIFFLLLYPGFVANAQRSRVSFEHIGIKEGLSESNIICILQDSRGFMWFGTWDGLNRYDGYKISVFKNNPLDTLSISNNFINKIAEDKNGNLWIGTSQGLNYFNRKKETFTRFYHQPANGNSIISNSVADLVVDEDGKLWVATNKGLDLYDPATGSFKHIDIFKNHAPGTAEPIRCLYKDSQKVVWVSIKDSGVVLYKAAQQIGFYKKQPNNDHSLASNNVNAIFEDSQKRLWLGTNGRGLELLSEDKQSFIHYSKVLPAAKPEDVILAINEDADKNIWISVENVGLLVFKPYSNFAAKYAHDEIDHESISNNSVYNIYRDNKKNIWLANFAGWVDVALRDKFMFPHYKRMLNINSLSHNQVMSIMEDSKKKIWISTDGGGLNIFDPVDEQFTLYKHNDADANSISGNYVVCTMEDHNGNFWIGTWKNGITVMDANRKVIKKFISSSTNTASLTSNNAWKILEDRDHNIWVATYGGGAEKLNLDGKTFTHYHFSNADTSSICSTDINNVFQDSEGDIWFSSEDNGFCILNKQTGKFRRFNHHENQNSISNNCVNSFYEDSDHNVWIGTLNGLNKFNKKTGLFKVYTVTHGLAGDYVFGILPDEKQHLWISTNKGISQFDPASGSFKNFGVADGLQSNEFKQLAYCKTSEGEMYFGGINGFNKFFPSQINKISFDPPLVFTSISIYNKELQVEKNSSAPSPLKQSISESSSITLPYSKDVFSIEFASLNYTDADKKKYAHWLEGFEKDWSEFSSARSVTYTHLDPGDYTFHIRGLDNDGHISATTKSLDIYIQPPFWLTWWFKSLCVFAFLGLLFLVYKIRVGGIRRQKKKLEYQVSMQTRELSERATESILAKERAEILRQEAEVLNEELKAKNKELEQFAYVASHDLQEPLRTTVSFVARLEKFNKDKLDERSSKYLHFIVEATNRMQVMIRDLLEFSRIGKAKTLQQVDINQVLKNVMVDLNSAIQESKAVINAGALPVINAYPTEIKALFQNLLTNAIKFRKPNSVPVININAQELDNAWRFSFKDNGIGIEEEHFNRIFAIFQRLHSTQQYAGSGIGLAHCKKIVELHQGTIWVTSVAGEGSCFHFDIAKNLKES